MGTGRAEVATTAGTTAAGTAGAVAAVVDGHVRGLETVEPPLVRGWTVAGGTATDAVRVTTDVRRLVADGTELVDDAASYAQLLGLAQALGAAGFVVDEVLDGWRTVAVDVSAAVTPSPAAPTDDSPQQPAEKAKKTKKAKKAKPPKASKPAKTPKSQAAVSADPAAAAAADAPKKARGGLLRRRSVPARADTTETDPETDLDPTDLDPTGLDSELESTAA